MTEDEYLALERASPHKHELINGHVVAMAGGSPRHNAICANLLGALNGLLRGGPCAPLTSDQRVHVPASGLVTYPDVMSSSGRSSGSSITIDGSTPAPAASKTSA